MTMAPADIDHKVDRILARHTRRRDEIINILQEVQEEFGYLPAPAMQRVADFLGVSASTVFSVSTFYALFKFVPTGKKMVKVCRGTACHVRGAPRILDEVQKKLKIKPGETTEDMEYSLEAVACFGSCALAPVMVVNDAVYGRMTPTKVDEILGKKRR